MKYMETRVVEVLFKTNADNVIVALPKCEEGEQNVTKYAFLEEEKVLFLPLSMYDIHSFRRLQNVWIRQILKLEKDTCPCCGGKLKAIENQKICNVCGELMITTTICPQKDCRRKYSYLSYRVSEEIIEKMQKVEETDFYQFDSLYQYKNTVKMRISDKKLRTVCPYCNR